MKKLAFVMAMVALTSSAFAWEIKNGELVNHQVSVKSGDVLNIKYMKRDLANKDSDNLSREDSVYNVTRMTNIFSSENNYPFLMGLQQVQIYNATDKTQHYIIKTDMKVIGDKASAVTAATITDELTLRANGVASLLAMPDFEAKNFNEKLFTGYIQTTVTNVDKNISFISEDTKQIFD